MQRFILISACLLATLNLGCTSSEPGKPDDAPTTPEWIVDDEPALDWDVPIEASLLQDIETREAAVEQNPESGEAHYDLAQALYQVNRRQEAVAGFTRAAELEPDNERYRLDLALAYTAMARLPEARVVYRTLIDSDTLRPVVLHNLGNIAYRQEELDDAIRLYRQALEARPEYVLARYHLGLALQEVGMQSEAYGEFDHVVEGGPYMKRSERSARFDSLYRMASLDISNGKPEHAARLLEGLLQYYPDHPNANYTYGRALKLLGRDEEAQQAFAHHLQVPRRTEGRVGFIGVESVDSAAGGSSSLRFEDATRRSGIRYRNVCGAANTADKGWATEVIGAGAAWLDYDGDGNLDLYLINGSAYGRGPLEGEPNQLYRGDGRGGFEDVTARAGVGHRGWGYGVAVGDVDNDGDADLYVTNYGPNVLYLNNGDGTFTDATALAGVGNDNWGVSAAFFDMDNDGDLDLYVGNYLVCAPGKVPRRGETPFCLWKGLDVSCGPRGLIPIQDVLYRNEGDGTFTDVTREAGMWLETARYTLGVVTADFDNDGDQDVYLANDSVQNSLWRNEGDGTFTDVSVVSMTAFNAEGHSQSGMGTDFGDYTGDGWLDIVATNFSHDLNSLYRNVGGKYFIDESSTNGLAVTNMMLSWGVGFHDFDRDADLDLFIANGHIFPEVDDYDLGTDYKQINHLFVNDGTGRLTESSAGAGPGLRIKRSFRGAAFGDHDNDGDIDVLLTALDDEVLLLENVSAADGHYLTVLLVGTTSNRDGVGARVTVTAGGRAQVRQRKGGGSYLSGGDPRLHFGLGDSKTVETLEVHWPSGRRDVLTNLKTDRLITIEEGSSPLPGDRYRGS